MIRMPSSSVLSALPRRTGFLVDVLFLAPATRNFTFAESCVAALSWLVQLFCCWRISAFLCPVVTGGLAVPHSRARHFAALASAQLLAAASPISLAALVASAVLCFAYTAVIGNCASPTLSAFQVAAILGLSAGLYT